MAPGLAEYKKKISIAVAIAVIAALGVGILAITIFPASESRSASTRNVTSTVNTISAGSQPPWSYSILGQEPYLRVSPKNHTFTIPFNVTTRDYSISLTYSQLDSYAWLFSNGTLWVSSARPCGPSTSATATGSTTTMTTTTAGPPILTHISQVPCGEFLGGWWPLNGTLISQHVAISPSDVQMTIQPSRIPAHYSGKMNVTVSIQMPPGNYGLFLAVHIQEPDIPNFGPFLLYILYYMPTVAQGE